MTKRETHPYTGTVKKLLWRSALAFAGTQAAVIGGLVATDAVKKSQRKKRTGFPRPGTYTSSVSDAVTTVYTYGADLYDAMIDEIDKAERHVFIQSYIWKDDETGRRFKDALGRAAERGVDVFVSYDGFANLVVRPRFYRFHPSVHVLRSPIFRPGIIFANPRSTGLDHRKILVVDDRVGFVGGYNIGAPYATEWRDTHLRIEGRSVWELRHAFISFWNNTRTSRHPELPDPGAGFWEPRLRSVSNAPAGMVFPIRGVYLAAINRATSHIFITTAYFIPDGQILDALTAASRRGVDVRVLVPEESNHVLSDWLSRGFYSELLDAGVTILLYENAMVHAKTATIDGKWTTVGTANIDRLSLSGNYEINMELYDDKLAADMERIFEVDSGNSRVLTPEEWQRRNVVARFAELVLVPLRPLL
ncbi:phospholipase D-like domain-containing protein [Spelaeicoccus albus]|uniref:Cardiolipin synthase n=1 Tax=Spelaeicoccus albus TaxID=1280376 RepID=A0A7Z0D4E9_9MICO|nr:phospholipase D-like domain-containing protein [Spelaeicoccus albus]NYI68611.1 cardiolipin synthase [Spelaeicoccus albus]